MDLRNVKGITLELNIHGLKEIRKGSLRLQVEYMVYKLQDFFETILHPHSTFINNRLVIKDHMDYKITKAITRGVTKLWVLTLRILKHFGTIMKNLKTLHMKI